jgi:hypothetical protein
MHTIVKSNSASLYYTHASKVISTLATRVQHIRKMANQLEKAFCVLEFHSTKSVITVQREFRRNFEKDPPTANSIRKWYQKFVNTGCICKGKSSGRPSTSAETIDRVRHHTSTMRWQHSWIGSCLSDGSAEGGSTSCPPRSPDLTPLRRFPVELCERRGLRSAKAYNPEQNRKGGIS